MRLDRLIPSMYQRRLLALMLVMGVGAAVPVLQLGRLTLAKGEELRADAEKRLITEQWLPTVRGRIVDRKGRVLAADRPSFDVAVDYSVITERWVQQRAARKVRDFAGFDYSRMSREQRESAAEQFIPALKQHLDQGWDQICQTAGISRADLEARKAEIREQVQYLAATVNERTRLREEARRQKAGGGDAAEVATAEVQQPIAEQSESHVILHDVPDDVGFAFRRLEAKSLQDESGSGGKVRSLPVMPGLHVKDSTRREYPFEVVDVPVDLSGFPAPLRRDQVKTVRVQGVATQVLGWMRSRIFKEDLQRRPRVREDGTIDPGHYRPGDVIGEGGVEQAMEERLRGLRGVQRTHLDTQQVETAAPKAGEDAGVTIDAVLQARIQALFDPAVGLAVVQPWQRTKKPEDEGTKPKAGELPLGTPLNGAAVVIDVATGDILAMVSQPSFTRQMLTTNPKQIFGDEYGRAFQNRCIDFPYPPGSIVKPLVLCGAVDAHRYDPGERIACSGHFFPDKPLMYRCWIYKQFHTTHSAQMGHDLDGADAIRGSCNIFFFEMGRRLGVAGIRDLFTSLGVGSSANGFNIFGLSALPAEPDARKDEVKRRLWMSEYRGSLPSAEKATIQEAILMGIGQGPITWTPLHAANAYATLARSGVFKSPRLLAGAPQQVTDLAFDKRAVTMALKGLHGSANEEFGTTYTITYDMPDGSRVKERIFDTPGVDIWAKSGTADTNPFRADFDLSGGREEFDGDHAWCVCLAGVGGVPKYAIAVVVDYGGSGGRVAGPLANQVVRALAAEGYLPNRKPVRPSEDGAEAEVSGGGG